MLSNSEVGFCCATPEDATCAYDGAELDESERPDPEPEILELRKEGELSGSWRDCGEAKDCSKEEIP